MALWGEKYRDYLTERLLPSLLAENNLPLLDWHDGHTLYIACPPEDWFAVMAHPIMPKIWAHMQVKLVPMEPPQLLVAANYATNAQYQEIYLRAALEAAFDRDAYLGILSPDFLVSDGMVSTALAAMADGIEVMIRLGMRENEGAASFRIGKRKTLTAWAAMQVQIETQHDEMLAFYDDCDTRHPQPPHRLWRMPDGGFVAHSFSTCNIVFFDCRIVPENHLDYFDHGALENTYADMNFPPDCRLKVVGDGEFTTISFTEGDYDPTAGWRELYRPFIRTNIMRELRGIVQMRRARRQFGGPFRDRLFLTPVRANVRTIGTQWRRREVWINRQIARAFSPSVALDLLMLLGDVALWWKVTLRARIPNLLKAIKGDQEVRRRLKAKMGLS